jgi:murein L,D-transpeptidase YcbB/YkuD
VNKRIAIFSVFIMMVAFLGIWLLNSLTGKSMVALGYPKKEDPMVENVISKTNSQGKQDETKEQKDNKDANPLEDCNVEYKQNSTEEKNIDTDSLGLPAEDDYSEVKFSRDLYKGLTGDDVKKAQYLLRKKGCYTGDITGIYDDRTKRAVIVFQQDNGITPTGKIGVLTRKALMKVEKSLTDETSKEN